MQKILEMKAANARGRSTPAPPLPLGEETLDLTLLPPENFRYLSPPPPTSEGDPGFCPPPQRKLLARKS
jgi:hypothetical protein